VDNSFWTSAVPSDHANGQGTFPAGLEFYFVPAGRIAGGEATIDGEEFNHLARVMRHGEGDRISIVDGAGMAYIAVVHTIDKRTARCRIESAHPELHEPTHKLALAVGVLKNPSRFEVIVEKATELGVGTIIPMMTTRTVPRHARTERWNTIALAAMKQCGRCRLPVVEPLTPFEDVISRKAAWRVILHERAFAPLGACSAAPGATIIACVGPEGGFTDDEVSQAGQLGWEVVAIGERRLRTETAAMIAAARLLLP
jgi:16S rRNA (uracil1498-N3)-methyltransferase